MNNPEHHDCGSEAPMPRKLGIIEQLTLDWQVAIFGNPSARFTWISSSGITLPLKAVTVDEAKWEIQHQLTKDVFTSATLIELGVQIAYHPSIDSDSPMGWVDLTSPDGTWVN